MDAIHVTTRKPLFWVVIGALSCVSILFTYKYYAHSNPLINLTISMDKNEALKKAAAIAQTHNLLPDIHSHAVKFESDSLLQFFVELEGGGKEQFIAMMKSHLFEPYTWHVRHFQEKVIEEAHIFFTPDGTPYRFIQKLGERQVKPNLSVGEARTLAQEEALLHWHVDFSTYKEIEASKDEKPCGRIDHTFVYERTDELIGTEGKYRLKLVVSGDMVTEVNPFVFIPETFKRRYEEMRASNETISTIGSLSFFLFYLFIGCIGAGLYFFRNNLLIFKPAALWALFIAVLHGISALNNLPFLWMSYDTTTSTYLFLSRYLLSVATQITVTFIFLSLAFSAALTWDRLAFPHRLNFWRLWSRKVGGSLMLLGQTIGGYAFAIIFLGIATGIYLFLTKIVGWWSPADTLSDPNILATYIPWIGAFGASLQAGFMEEALFRVVPLAAAVVLGKYYKRERLFTVIAFVAQAVIFAACHANYPQQPGYFRLVELLIPSGIFGILYLTFGLLPGLLAHFLYDFFLMTLPITISHTTHAWISKGIIFVLTLSPLWILLYRKLSEKMWTVPEQKDYNLYALPQEHLSTEKVTEPVAESSPSNLSLKNKIIFYSVGCIGLLLFVTCTQFTPDMPPLNTPKNKALCVAQQVFDNHAVETNEGMVWKALPYIIRTDDDQKKFIWQTHGKEKYKELLGSYLALSHWTIRYVSFTGDLICRARNFLVTIGPDATVLRTVLNLPESEACPSIIEGQARGLALEAVEEYTDLTAQELKEISAEAFTLPARKDWKFTFQDLTTPLEHGAQARVCVLISGNKVVDVYRFVFVPEDWIRAEQEKNMYTHLTALFFSALTVFLLLFALLFVQRRLFSDLALRKVMLLSGVLVPLAIFNNFNTCQNVISLYFNTTQSYVSQLCTTFALPLMLSIIGALITAFCVIAVKRSLITVSSVSPYIIASMATLSCFIMEGTRALIIYLYARPMPYILDYLPLNSYISFYETCISKIQPTLLSVVFSIFFTTSIILLTNNWTRYQALAYLLLFVFGAGRKFSIESFLSVELLCAIVSGILFVTIYITVFKRDQTALIIFCGTQAGVEALVYGLGRPYPGALLEGILASILIWLASYCWFLYIRNKA